MPVVVPLIAGALIGGAVSGISSAANAKSAKAASQVGVQPNAMQTVGDAANKTANAQNSGRAALISTSPSGVLGSDPTGRRRLLGNE